MGSGPINLVFNFIFWIFVFFSSELAIRLKRAYYFLIAGFAEVEFLYLVFPVWGAEKDGAKRGGRVVGNARKEAEKELQRPIVSSVNYLSEPERKKRLEDKSKK